MSYIILNYIDRLCAGYEGPVDAFITEQEEMYKEDDAYCVMYYLMDELMLSTEQAARYWNSWKAVNM